MPKLSPQSRKLRGKIAAERRHHGRVKPEVLDEFRAARSRDAIDEHIRAFVAAMPPLTPEQAERLRQLLPPVPRDAPSYMDGDSA